MEILSTSVYPEAFGAAWRAPKIALNLAEQQGKL